jgi:hypothetical protein
LGRISSVNERILVAGGGPFDGASLYTTLYESIVTLRQIKKEKGLISLLLKKLGFLCFYTVDILIFRRNARRSSNAVT